MNRHQDFARLERSHGIVLPGVVDYIQPQMAQDFSLAMDAQPGLVTVSSSGIPAFLSNFMDPKVITVLTTPNKGAQILGETKKGDWTTQTATFTLVESTGETSAYGDWNNNGNVNINAQFPQRQSFHYQTITQWGEKQLEVAGLAKIDWATRLNVASAMVLDKFQNLTYFYGVAGLQNYGLLNDPSLPAPIQPVTKAAGGKTWAVATASEVYADIQALFTRLVAQTNGLVDADTKMVLATSPGASVALTNTNSFNVNVYDQLKKNFPNIRFETAPQYAVDASGTPNAAGTIVQLIAEEIDGQETGVCAFTEKMRAHPVILDLSSFKQKKSQGSWGAVIFLPVAVAQMVGV